MVWAEIIRRIHRSARNGERLHLEVEHVRAIVTSPLFVELAKLEQEELTAKWASDAEPGS